MSIKIILNVKPHFYGFGYETFVYKTNTKMKNNIFQAYYIPI